MFLQHLDQDTLVVNKSANIEYIIAGGGGGGGSYRGGGGGAGSLGNMPGFPGSYAGTFYLLAHILL